MRLRSSRAGGHDRAAGGEGGSRRPRRARGIEGSEGEGTGAKPTNHHLTIEDPSSHTERVHGAICRPSWDTEARGEAGRWVAGDVERRFWSKVVVVVDDCWWWAPNGVESRRGLDEHGYGRFKQQVDGLWLPRKAHVVAWELTRGPVPACLRLDHLCHSFDDGTCPGGRLCVHRRCVRPDHLEPVTVEENNRRRVARTAPRRDP